MRSVLIPLMVLGFLSSVPVVGQEPETAAVVEEVGDDPDRVVASDQAVDVQAKVADRPIAERLREILVATERFRDLEVTVRDGVVFLRGRTERADTRELAGDLAQRTEGVAAVVNNIRIDEGPLWNLQPARRELENLVRAAFRSVPLLVIAVIILLLSVLAARLVSAGTRRLLDRTTDSPLLVNVARKAAFLFVIIAGVYLALRVSGMTRIAVTVVSGTGLVGLVLGFAFRDIAENFLASVLLSIQRPFRLGDMIEVQGHLGMVRKVTSRGTLLIDFDGNHIQLSNATVYKSTIKNMSANPRVRGAYRVGIGYDDDIEQAQQVILGMLAAHPAVLNDPAPQVLVDELGASTVNLLVFFWIRSSEHSLVKVRSSAIRLTASVLTEAGISMPDEAREVIFPQGVPVQMQPADDSSVEPGTERALDPSPPAVNIAREVREEDLSSERHELEEQARTSRDPEQGENILADEPNSV